MFLTIYGVEKSQCDRSTNWIDAPILQNGEFGCTLMRCKADWLEIWTPSHGPNQSQTFPPCNNVKV